MPGPPAASGKDSKGKTQKGAQSIAADILPLHVDVDQNVFSKLRAEAEEEETEQEQEECGPGACGPADGEGKRGECQDMARTVESAPCVQKLLRFGRQHGQQDDGHEEKDGEKSIPDSSAA